LPLRSFSIILGMEWLSLNRTKVDCYDKSIEFLDENGEQRIFQGKKKETSVRMVASM